jgi:hypothetical protein
MGALSMFEMFTGYNWEQMSKQVGSITPLICVGSAFAASFFPETYNFTVSLWCACIGALLCIWEFPIAVAFVPRIDEIKYVFLEKFQMKKHLFRALLYVVLSWTLWQVPTFCVMGALTLDISALLYVFAYINARADAADGIRSSDTGEEEAADAEAGQAMLSSSRFGTF